MMHTSQHTPFFKYTPPLPVVSDTPSPSNDIRPSMRERRMQQSQSRFITDRFGTRLRELRTSRHMNQIDMAVAFGIDRSFISDVERGRKSIGLPMLEVIAIGFGMTLAELLDDL